MTKVAKNYGLILSAILLALALPFATGSGCFFQPQPTPTGACCAADETCSVTTEAGCAAAGGTYQGDNTSCDPSPCVTEVTGACCAADGSCSVTTEAGCGMADGTYQGDGSVCDPNPCAAEVTGACCAADNSCTETTESACDTAGGTYQGDNTTCDPNPCETAPNGATLFADNCASCHGADGTGGVGPDITGKSAAEISAKIDAGGLHAGYADLTEAEIQAIADFLSS